MATLIPALGACVSRMTTGERRLAERLEPSISKNKSSNMTQNLNQQNEAKKTPFCDSCAGIQRNWRGAPGHAELMQGVNRKEPRSHGQVTLTKYRCERCGTEWEYENNKVNLHAGWSVVGQS